MAEGTAEGLFTPATEGGGGEGCDEWQDKGRKGEDRSEGECGREGWESNRGRKNTDRTLLAERCVMVYFYDIMFIIEL